MNFESPVINMAKPSQKGIFITRYEAIRNFVTMTVIYVVIIFNREIFAWQKGVTVEELYKHKSSGIAVILIGSFFYFSFFVFLVLISFGQV